MTDLKAVADALHDPAQVIYFESPSNPNMRLVDISAIAALAKACSALVVVDNTFCTPFIQKPLKLGADVVVHSATKYISGHGDVTAGLVVTAHADLAKKFASRVLKT